jgi:hypothetical protein
MPRLLLFSKRLKASLANDGLLGLAKTDAKEAENKQMDNE